MTGSCTQVEHVVKECILICLPTVRSLAASMMLPIRRQATWMWSLATPTARGDPGGRPQAFARRWHRERSAATVETRIEENDDQCRQLLD